MGTMKPKKILLAAFGAIALTAVLAAGAFACTVFRGTLSLKGNASTATVKATGTGTGMTQTLTSSIAKAHQTNGSVTLTTGADAYGRKLPARNTYYVRYYNSNSDPAEGPGYTDHYHWWTDCMYGGPGKTLAGPLTIGSDGKIVGSRTFGLGDSPNRDSGGQESAVCISDSGGAFGNQAPVTIVL
jgi:hypothetical protein